MGEQSPFINPEGQSLWDFYEVVTGVALTEDEKRQQYIFRTVDDIDAALERACQFSDSRVFDEKKYLEIGYVAGILCPDGRNLMLWQGLLNKGREENSSHSKMLEQGDL